jgi:hypothetical protein
VGAAASAPAGATEAAGGMAVEEAAAGEARAADEPFGGKKKMSRSSGRLEKKVRRFVSCQK